MKQFDFGKIKEFREAASMTQEQLAVAMSTPESRVHTQQVNEWECNRRDGGGITVKSLVKLCDALGKTTDDFFVDNDLT